MLERDLFGEVVRPSKSSILAARFGVPPFSVLNAREGSWQERKRRWLALGIRSEVGRGENLLKFSDTVRFPAARAPRNGLCFNTGDWLEKNGTVEKAARDRREANAIPGGGTGKNSAWMFRTDDGYATGDDAQALGTGTSIFDPVLCELAYRWFCPVGGSIIDPFAGGSVRGVVASVLGYHYTGIDLSDIQVEANRQQAHEICDSCFPDWHAGDSRYVASIAGGPHDFVFSCPPYGDLERYSDDPRDLSTMSFDGFIESYREIIAACARSLRPDRFAAFVVGDYRGPDGNYRNFVGETISAFQAAGMALYNEAILLTMVGTLPIRVTAQFEKSRKLGKTHQNLLVFVKGDPRAATALTRAGESDGQADAP